MAELRESQVETLRHLDELEGATAAELGERLNRTEWSAEKRLIRLIDLDPPLVSYRYEGPSWAAHVVYSLTDKGKAALLDREGSR